MMNSSTSNNKFFIDVGFSQLESYGQEICGDVFMSRKIAAENRTIVVLSDGLGKGVKANILASMTASMALNFISKNSQPSHTADIIMETLPIDKERKISFSSFTIIDIEANGLIHILEYGNPEIIVLGNKSEISLKREELRIANKYNLNQKLYYSRFEGNIEDRLVVFSDGVTQSGIGSRIHPFGWGISNVKTYLTKLLCETPDISSKLLCERLLRKSISNDANKAKDDITIGSIYLRNPRKLMLCTGPPYDEGKDHQLAKNLDAFKGTKVICGGTTANIIARELNRDITTSILQHRSALPPVSTIDNIDFVSEGILTIGKTFKLLEEDQGSIQDNGDSASTLCKLLLSHDEIHFVVGTKINEAHQDPSLPVELEIRRNVIKRISKVLEEKHLKKTIIEYI